MKSKYINLIKSIIFVFIFFLLWHITFSILWTTDNSISNFYKEKNNSLDVVYVGSSNAYAHFNTVLAYNEYGFTTGMMSSDSQTFAAIEYLMKEAEKYQKPKVYVIDLTCLTVDLAYYNEGDIRKVTDEMKWSQNRSDTIETLLKYSNIEKSKYPSFYFSFLTYHNTWKHISPYSFNNFELFKGHLLSSATVVTAAQPDFVWNKNLYNELPKENVNVLNNLLSYIKKSNLNAVFILPPRNFTDAANALLNNGIDIIEKQGYKVINFNEYVNEIGINYANDYYNAGHLNVRGAAKFTEYFAKHLSQKYKLPNHKNDNNYASWDEEYENYKKYFNILLGSNYDDLLNQIKDNSN